MKMFYKTILIGLFSLLTLGFIQAVPRVSAELPGEVYNLDDEVIVKIMVEDNPGFHGLYFDLAYDGNILLFEGISKGLLAQRASAASDFLYAVSDPVTSTTSGKHLVVSFGLREKAAITQENGVLAEIRFRVIAAGNSGAVYHFTFDDCAAKDAAGAQITTFEWVDSPAFVIGEYNNAAFINIQQPQQNQVFCTDSVLVNLICTIDATYTVTIVNEDKAYTSTPLSAASGAIVNHPVSLASGFNRLKAVLKDQNGREQAIDEVLVYRSQDEDFIRITSPSDHALINTDMVEVLVSASAPAVTVNNLPAELLLDKDEEQNRFRARLWLQQGFNEIIATATGPGGEIYRDTISVFYRKDDTIFRFVTPLAGETFKTGSTVVNTLDGGLKIYGEIGSQYRTENALNTVTLRLIYYPKSSYLSPRVLVDDRPAVIRDTTIAQDDSRAPYMFTNDFPINLANLENGEIEIIAYKNKVNGTWENEIHRFIYVNNGKLTIDLIQPNIFNKDVLDTKKKIAEFNNLIDPAWGSIELSHNGTIMLGATDKELLQVPEFAGKKVVDMIEVSDGSLYALVNENDLMKIYKRNFGAENWGQPLLSRDDMHGYVLCETSMGILVGVSNLFSADNSGLYILKEDSRLVNIIIGEPITHVQFISNNKGFISLYGNNYSHLYSFNIYSLEEYEGRLKAETVEKVPFYNDDFIRQFILSQDRKTAVIRDSNNRICFYQNLYDSGFRPVTFPGDKLDPAGRFTLVVKGEYTVGAYNAYCLVKEDNSILVVMENKATNRLILNNLTYGVISGEELLGINFINDNFSFIHKAAIVTGYEYRVRRGQILFDTLYLSTSSPGVIECLVYRSNNHNLARQNLRFLSTRLGLMYLGLGEDLQTSGLYEFTRSYPDSGSLAFAYHNRDIEGVSGFSFEVERIWLDSAGLFFGFAVKEQNGTILFSSTDFGSNTQTLTEFLNTTNSYYTVSHTWDESLKKELVSVTFNELIRCDEEAYERYLDFALKIVPVGNMSPALANLTIYKKVPVRIPRAQGEIVYLPVQGWIHDPTVSEVLLQERCLPLERGFFSCNYPLNACKDEIKVTIFCRNPSREEATLTFKVEIFDSVNDLKDVLFKENGMPLSFDPANPNQLTTISETLTVSGKYFGLTGAVAGYELYSYVYDEAAHESLKNLSNGVFSLVPDEVMDPLYKDSGTGYESGAFTDQPIKLFPGRQRLIIYVQNPGGLRKEFRIEKTEGSEKTYLYPDVTFNLPADEQEIRITNLELEAVPLADQYAVNDIIVDKRIRLTVNETTSAPYAFTKKYLISGEVKSLYNVNAIRVKSTHAAVTFANNLSEIVVPVNEMDRFGVEVTLVLPEETEKAVYNLLFIPDAPFMEQMKTGLELVATKSFQNTSVIPDFSLMAPALWTETELLALQKPLRVNIARFIPEGSIINLVVNYEVPLSGTLVKVNPGEKIYKVMSGLDELKLPAKAGTNRVRWELTHEGKTISSSLSGKAGMNDYLFTLLSDVQYQPTVVTFPIAMQSYYDNNQDETDGVKDLPKLTIAKHTYTYVQVKLNGISFWTNAEGVENWTGDLTTGPIKEGKNFLSVYYEEKSGVEKTLDYSFLYDSTEPEATIVSWQYSSDNQYLTYLEAIVKEANFKNATLIWYRGADSVVQSPYLVTDLENGMFRVEWPYLADQVPVVDPSALEPVRIRVTDQADRHKDSAPFTGITVTQKPVTEDPVLIGLSPWNFSGDPVFMHEPGSTPFVQRLKFYNDHIFLKNKQITEDFTVQRPESISVGENFNVTTNGALHLKAGNKLSIRPGFSVQTGRLFNAAIGSIQAASPVVFTHNQAAHNLSFAFWFRYEPEDYYFADTQYRKILTIYDEQLIDVDNGVDLRHTIYLAYKDFVHPAKGDECVYLLEHVQGLVDNENFESLKVLLGANNELKLTKAGRSEWNLILLSITGWENTADNQYGIFRLAVNDQYPLFTQYPLNEPILAYCSPYAVTQSILAAGQSYYFGDTDTDRTGHYSLAQAFYINRVIAMEDLPELAAKLDTLTAEGQYEQFDTEPRRYYAFNSATDDIGEEDFFKLRIPPPALATDYFRPEENADYTEAADKGALSASALHKNYLKTGADGSIVFLDEEKPYPVKMTYATDNMAGWIRLIPDGSTYPGRYYFSQTNKTHGLLNNRWYSIYGRVLATESETIDARLVLSINGKEQSMQLPKGEFHFIYTNTTGAMPTSVVLYIETKTELKLDQKLYFTEGNYKLPAEAYDGLEPVRALTEYYFQKTGTLAFWYKPLNANEEGFVNYETTLIDSEYYKIYTRLTNDGYTVYSALLKGTSENLLLESGVPVTSGWQHLQLSYSVGNKLVYFYVNGEVAAFSENIDLPVSWTMLDHAPSGDNLCIGAALNQNQYGEGFFDEVSISHLYKEAVYQDRSPLFFAYTEQPAPSLTVTTNLSGLTISDIYLRLEAKDGSHSRTLQPASLDNLGIDFTTLAPGAYLLKARMLINGHRYAKTFAFVRNDKPRFVLQDITPLIVKGVESDISFLFDYDNSYLLTDAGSRYAGLAVEISGTNESGKFTRSYYVTQDYQNVDRKQWLVMDAQTGLVSPFPVTSNSLQIVFESIKSLTSLSWAVRAFYFEGMFDPADHALNGLNEDLSGTIDEASIHVEKEYHQLAGIGKNYEYKLKIRVGDDGAMDPILLNDLSIGYLLTNQTTHQQNSSPVPLRLDRTGRLELYYDDILPENGFGVYDCIISLRYRNETYGTAVLELNWEQIIEEIALGKEKRLDVTDFSILHINKKTLTNTQATARLYIEYEQNGLTNLYYDLKIIQPIANSGFTGYYRQDRVEIVNINSQNFLVLDAVPIPEDLSYAKLFIYELVTEEGVEKYGLKQELSLTIVNAAAAPEVQLTNSVPSMIAYNNVMFSWYGYIADEFNKKEFNAGIQYTYSLDNKGKSVLSNEWRQVEYYNLSEGAHVFKVQACYNDKYSPEASVTFFVDINRPVFDAAKITVREITDSDGMLYAVEINGAAGAVSDSSLKALLLNGEKIDFASDGSFSSPVLPLLNDGENLFKITAYDKVGNFTDYDVKVDNNLTRILFPVEGQTARYSPLSVVGFLNGHVNSGVEIYLADPSTKKKGLNDFTDWKKARINQDRTFLIEDVYITPGTREKETHTPLTMAVVLASGKVFTRTIDVKANEIIMPLEMELSVQAVEGENADQLVTIDCQAKVDNISSWSIDFNGDGIYDEVKMVDNPALGPYYKTEHMYSALGLIKPRARVITRDGNFFSVTQELIIHEKIKAASNTLITAPIALSSLRMPDDSYRVYILAGTGNNYRIEVYEIGRNESYISTKLFTIDLKGLGIENPVKVKAINAGTIYLASNRGGLGYMHLLMADDYGNYVHRYEKDFVLDDLIHDFDASADNLYISLVNTNNLVTVPLEDGLPAADRKTAVSPALPHALPLGGKLSLAKETEGLLVADYYRQRLVRLSSALKITEFYGQFGMDEGDFIYPAQIEAYENRIFVYDESRKDIQIFGPDFELVTTLRYKNETGYENYLDSTFLNDLAGISVMTRVEGNRLFYYALLLSRASSKLAVLRLPQWDELRARVRNNKLVFLNNKEVFSAKLSGSDLTRLLSSDTLPRVEGALNYPALSPDGRHLVFTSRTRLYDGNGTTGDTTSSGYAYDNLYIIDEDGKNLTRIPLGVINNYEIERPVFNSNGDKIIFSAKPTGGKWQIYVYSFTTGTIGKLFESDENARFPYYSPDDRFVVFTTDYDGDEDIEILDTKNPSIRVAVTNNNARDAFPVWHAIFPFEIAISEYKIDSKIAFVSERDYHKGLYYTYIKRPVESDVQVVTIAGQPVGNDPDSAAIEISTIGNEGDYPCYVGDGKALIYEYFDGARQLLKQCAFDEDHNHTFTTLNIPAGATRPAGMKNTIANFTVTPINGDEVKLVWSRYTEKDVPYIVSYRINKEDAVENEKKIFSQNGTIISGLQMGQEYLFRVAIRENNEDVASSQIKKVLMPKIVARASYELDKENPYLVRLHAWKPEGIDTWKFAWLIDNQEIKVQSSQDYMYEFATSGSKTILLKAYITDTETSISEPLYVDIVSDIKPVIEYVLTDDTSHIELNASNSLGKRIDWAATSWSISGPGQAPLPSYSRSKIIVPLDKFEHKINVNLTLSRIPVTGQAATDTIEMNKVIDLDYKEVKPVITYEVSKSDARLLTFDGSNSIGNIDWYGARWYVYADGNVIHNVTGVSSFAFAFPESGSEVNYSVSLTIPRRNDGLTETASIIVSIEPKALEPVIDYEILKITGKDGVEGAKLLLSCGNSKGNNIDYLAATWNVPVAGTYGEQPTQRGPTAMYNLFNISEETQLDVELTLVRRGGTDTASLKKTIQIKSGDIPVPEVVINKTLSTASTGYVLMLDALSSRGPNLDWERIEWQINGDPYPKRGPVAQIDIPPSDRAVIVRYVCTVYRFGDKPLTKTEEFEAGRWTIKPHITTRQIPGKNKNIYELSVRETRGINIDWDKTRWFIYDGNENVNERTGAAITHTFAFKEDTLGYPVMVQMFFKDTSYPFVGYTTIDVEGDELIPIITWDAPDERTDPNMVHLSAQTSRGSNIDWSQTKWTFGDSSEGVWGATAIHEYPLDSHNKQYKVSLTLTRRNTNGTSETKTVYKNITIGSDVIKPVITARLPGDGYLVLSAEDSEGRNLMLDRSLWTFEGKGDQETLSTHTEGGVIKRNSTKIEDSMYMNTTKNFYHQGQVGTGVAVSVNGVTVDNSGPNGTFVKTGTMNESNMGVSASATNDQLVDTVDYSDYTNQDETFSSQNSHTGAICRRYVAGAKNLYVTLFVYRANPGGGIDGESITVNIDLAKAGQPGGVKYE